MAHYYGVTWLSSETGGVVQHFGIKGQKWGIRRFQNEDGSLTPEGKERYASYSSLKMGNKLQYAKQKVERARTDKGKAKAERKLKEVQEGLKVNMAARDERQKKDEEERLKSIDPEAAEIIRKPIETKVFGRDFKLPVNVNIYPGEKMSEEQKEAAKWINKADYSTALPHAKKYISDWSQNSETPLKVSDIKNVFKYIMPESIHIPNNNSGRNFGIMCNSYFDPEHGCVIFFQGDKCLYVDMQDRIL